MERRVHSLESQPQLMIAERLRNCEFTDITPRLVVIERYIGRVDRERVDDVCVAFVVLAHKMSLARSEVNRNLLWSPSITLQLPHAWYLDRAPCAQIISRLLKVGRGIERAVCNTELPGP